MYEVLEEKVIEMIKMVFVVALYIDVAVRKIAVKIIVSIVLKYFE